MADNAIKSRYSTLDQASEIVWPRRQEWKKKHSKKLSEFSKDAAERDKNLYNKGRR